MDSQHAAIKANVLSLGARLLLLALLCLALCACSGAPDKPELTPAPSPDLAQEPLFEEDAVMALEIKNMQTQPGIYFEPDTITAYAPSRGGAWYPRLYGLADGTLLCGFDSNEGGGQGVCQVVRSSDGINWSAPVKISDWPELGCANTNFIQLKDGTILAAYRANSDEYTSIRVSASVDNGYTWKHHSIIAEEIGSRGVYEPHFGWIGDTVAVFYANDSLNVVNESMEQNIEYKLFDGEGWSEKSIASDGTKTHSRDGMPVWDQTIDGRYCMAVEATNESGYPFVIQMKFSPDGLDWSEPLRNIYVPYQKGKKAGAPYLLALPDGRLAVSLQTDDDAAKTGDGASYMKVMFSLDSDGLWWSQPTVPFLMPENACANWNALYLHDGYLYMATSANYPKPGIFLRRASLAPKTAPGQNVVTNGQFVFKNTQNWEFAMDGKVYHGEFPAKQFESKAGNHALTIINNKGVDIGLVQDIPGVEKGSYILSAKLSSEDGAKCSLRVKQGEETLEFEISPSKDQKEYQTQVSLQSGPAEISLVMLGGTGRLLTVDDIALAKEQ